VRVSSLVSLDALAMDVVQRSGCQFSVAASDAERDEVYRLRHVVIGEQGWTSETCRDGIERDNFDDRAVHIVGRDDGVAVATGRIVLPPGPLPTEEACGISVTPAGGVVDVGRMAVLRSHQGIGHPIFLALLARLYLEVRALGYEAACGMMSPRARSVLRLLGLDVELLGDDRLHWAELRAPVRFPVLIDPARLSGRWE
jgi:N-acyl-L-homoserine lactone synthetase